MSDGLYHCNFCKGLTFKTKEEFIEHATKDPRHLAKGQKYLALYNAENQSQGKVSTAKFIEFMKQVSDFEP